MTVKLADAVKMRSKNKLKAARRIKTFDELPAEKLLKESEEHAASPLKSQAKAKLRAETFVGAQVVKTEIQTPSSRCGRPSSTREPRRRKLCSAFSCCSDCGEVPAMLRNDPCDTSSAASGAVQTAWPGFKVFAEKRPLSLRPLAGASEGGWEFLEAILDSGATVTVIPPHVGK